MTFGEFQRFRSEVLAENPSLTDFAETNLWRALSSIVPAPGIDHPDHVYRCHLARKWLEVFGLPTEWSKRALVSSGVRHSLSLIFPILANRNIDLRIPEDVYPVYGQLAQAAELPCKTFATLPEIRIPAGGDYLLLANPLKPAGRWLTAQEVSDVCHWLRVDDRRRVLLDTVYTFDTRWHSSTRELLETQQVILLHSLSKGWLTPQVFGITLIPEHDAELWSETFRKNSPSQENLKLAHSLLHGHADCPPKVAANLEKKRSETLARLPNEIRNAIIHPPLAEPAGYLITVRFSHFELLSKFGLVAIPLSVFGSSLQDYSVLSILNCK